MLHGVGEAESGAFDQRWQESAASRGYRDDGAALGYRQQSHPQLSRGQQSHRREPEAVGWNGDSRSSQIKQASAGRLEKTSRKRLKIDPLTP